MANGAVQNLEVLFESRALLVETVPLELADQAVDHLVFALVEALGVGAWAALRDVVVDGYA